MAPAPELEPCTDGRALFNPFDLAMSADGRHLYTVSPSVSALAVLSRNDTGVLSQAAGNEGCVSNVVIGCGGAPEGMSGGGSSPRGIATSPDGETVYVTDFGNDSVIAFDRDSGTGGLTPLGVASGGGEGDTCLAHLPTAPDTNGCTNVRALNDPRIIEVAPDGENVYVTSQTSQAIAVFDRDTSGADKGKLTQPAGVNGCVSDNGTSEEATGCVDGQELAVVNQMPIAISGDGASVYVGGFNSLLHLTRAGDGALTPAQCLSAAGGCTAANGITAGVQDVELSPGDAHVYAVNGSQGVLANFARMGNGNLTTPNSCQSAGAIAGCTTGLRAVNGATGLDVSPDGKTVYTAAGTVGADISNAVSVFSRNIGMGGLPEQLGMDAGCIAETPGTPANTTSCANGKDTSGGVEVVVSPDNRHVYAANSNANGGVASFARQLPPQCVGGQLGGTLGPGPNTLNLNCPDANGDAITQYVVNDPPHGTLGAPNVPGNSVSYTPDEGYDGPDLFLLNAAEDSEFGQAVTVNLDVDTIAPTAGVTGGPDGTIASATPTFAFDANEPATFECRVDSEAFGSCSGPGQMHTTAPLADGPHSFEVRATDVVGLQGTASRAFTVDTPDGGGGDTDPPDTKIKKVKVKGDDIKVKFTSDEPGSTFVCKLNKKPFKPCTSPKKYRNLDDGKHKVLVKATDPAGNTDPSAAKKMPKVD